MRNSTSVAQIRFNYVISFVFLQIWPFAIQLAHSNTLRLQTQPQHNSQPQLPFFQMGDQRSRDGATI